MRKDISKIIVERPRYNSKCVRKGRKVNDELLPNRQGMRRPHLLGYNQKQLNENLAPLRRFLNSSVGRKWDDVYSEICKNLKITSTVQEHVRGHVTDFVALNISIGKNGKLLLNTKYRTYEIDSKVYFDLYVDPIDKILKNVPDKYKWNKHKYIRPVDKDHAIVDDLDFYKIDGIWYTVDWEKVPDATYITRIIDDVEYKRLVNQSKYDVISKLSVYSGNWCRVKKIQLNSDELKKYNLKND